MASAAGVLTWFALAGAVASFIAGLVLSERASRNAHLRLRWLFVAAWPLAIARLKAAAGSEAAILNKALVAFITCLMIAAAAWSAAANLHRFAR
jgi:hypothetical protein